MKLAMVALTDIGNVRLSNEDTCAVYEDKKLALVCDGMGGHNAGARASQTALEIVTAFFDLQHPEMDKVIEDVSASVRPVAAHLIGAIRLANHRIFSSALKDQKLKGMGTTVSAIAFEEGVVHVGHVGDSRVYRFRKGKMDCLTEDHTWVNELLQDKEITEEQVASFEKKNIITRAVGMGLTSKIDIISDYAEKDDLFLICSDGLHNSLDDDMIREILSQDEENLELSALCLIAKAKELGGRDNITVALARVEQTENAEDSFSPIAMTIPNEDEQTTIAERRVLKHQNQEASGRQYKNSQNLMRENGLLKISIPIRIAAIVFVFMLGFIARGFTSSQIKFFAHEPNAVHRDSEIKTPAVNPAPMLKTKKPVEMKTVPGSHPVLALVYYQDAKVYKSAREQLSGIPLDIISVQPPGSTAGYQVNIHDAEGKLIYSRDNLLAQATNGFEQIQKSDSGDKALNNSKPSIIMDGEQTELPLRTLATRSDKYGKLFLVGFAHRQKLENSDVLLNDHNLGKIEKFVQDGMYMKPGKYTISFRDSLGNILREYPDIVITAGKVKALEYK